MSDSAGNQPAAAADESSVRLATVFHADRIQVCAEAAGAKRVLEILAHLLTRGHEYEIEKKTVYRVLAERERLGSTCVGNGIALPHGRLHDLPCPIGALVRLTRPVGFGGIDDDEIDIACGLLVPGNCADVHMRLVGRLARSFETADLRQRVLDASDAIGIHQVLTECDNEQS